MKCIILAGGTGDSLWPLSRQKYPKQFMNFHDSRSLFQEAVARNMTFCDEFIIVTNMEFRYIVEAQIKSFQGLHYKLVLEELGRKTGPAIIMSVMLADREDDILLVTADHLVQGEGYMEDVISSKAMAADYAAVIHGIRPNKLVANLTYVKMQGEKISEYYYRPDMQDAGRYVEEGDYLVNTGISFFRAGKYLNMVRDVNEEVFTSCANALKQAASQDNVIVIRAEAAHQIPEISIDEAVYMRTIKSSGQKRICFRKCSYQWIDIGSLLVYDDYKKESDSELCIENNCNNVMMVNRGRDRLLVTNDLQDTIVISTEDAVFVSSRERAEDIKKIVQDYHAVYPEYFDNDRTSYRFWGLYELIYNADSYKVKKVTLYPGMHTNFHRHEYRTEQWTIVKGTATITLEDEVTNFYMRKDYGESTAVSVPVGMAHMIENRTKENVEIVEVSVGKKITNSDVIFVSKEKETDSDEIVKLSPAFKDYLWGGTKLKTDLGKHCDYDIVAESWELSAHPDGLSRVASGQDTGMLFNDYIDKIGKEALGWKCQHYDRFPILIKFIDAAKPLSIQIHPDDEFALEHEGEYGKNEMWYIMDCDEGAYIYFGTKGIVSKEELRRRIKDNTILEVLNKVYVNKGDTFFVKAGTIHAIGGGILICEIQQNSNCTYRMYDYDRRDKYGHPRELHVDKAIAVVDNKEEILDELSGLESAVTVVDGKYKATEEMLLSRCKYFECRKYEVKEHKTLKVDESSFVSVMVIEGSGRITGRKENIEFHYGDSFFIPAKNAVFDIEGECQLIVTHV